jgi:PAS domain S-box-containing protein
VTDPDALLARSPELVVVVDRDGVVRYHSAAAKPILGYEDGGLVGESFLSRVHPDDRALLREAFAADADATPPDSIEHRFRDADGSWRWLETSRSPDYDAAVGGYVTTARDIGRRKVARRERMLDRMDDAFMSIDADWRVSYLNDEAASLLETTPDVAVGTDVRELLDTDDDARLIERYREAMTTQQPVAFESRVAGLDTTLEIRAFPSPTGLSVYFRDVTESRRIKRELERTVETLQHLHEIAAATDIALSEKRVRLLEAGRRHLDLPYGFITRMTDGRQTIVEAVGDHDLLRAGNTCPIEESYCRKTVETDGLLAIEDAAERGWSDDPAYDTFGLESYIGGRLEIDGELYGTLCFAAVEPRARVFADSERTFVELAARWLAYEIEEDRYRRRLELQNERLDNFASVLSHDLRNPLNVAIGRLELAADRYDDADIDAAASALDRTFDLIDDVLAFSRAGADVLDPERVSVPSVAERAWAIVDPDPADSPLDVAPDTGTVTADRTRLQQLLENLFRNSVEHGSTALGNGGVSVTVGPLDDHAGFVVADDGPGIAPDRREAAFELGHTDDDGGSGLGLAIVREIAEAHGWQVELTASADGGARFEVVTDGASTGLLD